MKRQEKEYYLMHKDIPVCLMEISDEGIVSNVRKNADAFEHFPPGGQMNDMKFHEWWNDRAIPKTRHGAKTALERLGYSSTGNALVNNLALSLSDCYWIKPRSENLAWKDVSLFTNHFVDTFGEITINLGHTVDIRNETRFNCATTQGELQKKWCIDDTGKRFLVKGNYGGSYQQSLNELFASNLHSQQGFDNYTVYYLTKLKTEVDEDALGCFSYCFCNESVESISAWELLQTVKIRQNESLYYPLKDVCLGFGMPEEAFDSFMDYQIMTDFLLSNTDRHMNNISVLRDPDSLRLLGFAPIYDSGNSMFFNASFETLKHADIKSIKTHSFVEREVRLLRYVANRNLVDPDKSEMDFSIYEKDIPERRGRIPYLKKIYDKKLRLLTEFIGGQDIWKEKYHK
ncbi:MAG: hypothetical protein IJU01_07080 [Lachnospiraceae bacterium]|nr:hypothetical protein [Lachnospiraceae bacterium]